MLMLVPDFSAGQPKSQRISVLAGMLGGWGPIGGGRNLRDFSQIAERSWMTWWAVIGPVEAQAVGG